MNDKQIMHIDDNADDRDLTIRARKKNNVFNPSPSPATVPKHSQCFSGTGTATRTARRSSCST
jgi:hypothetical protein